MTSETSLSWKMDFVVFLILITLLGILRVFKIDIEISYLCLGNAFSGIAFEQIYTPPCTEGEFTFEKRVKEISKGNETLIGENGAVYTKRRVLIHLQYSNKYQIIEQSQAYTGKLIVD